MADMKPIKAVYSGSDPVGLKEFESTDTLGLIDGGTGATTAAAALANLLPAGTDGYFLQRDSLEAADCKWVTNLNADTVDNIHGASLLRSDAADDYTGTLLKINGGNLFVNTNSGTNALIIGRTSSTAKEWVKHTVEDTKARLYYNNDEASSVMEWVLENTDTESGGGVGANTTYMQLYGEAANPRLLVDGHLVWTAGNDGGGSGLDADTVDSLQGSQLLRSDEADTQVGGLLIQKANWDPLTIERTNSAINTTLVLKSTSYTMYLGIGNGNTDLKVGADENINSNGYKIWHAGNDGTGSTLDADTVDGIEGVDIMQKSGGTFTGTITVPSNLTVQAADGTNEGGEILLLGAAANPNWSFDVNGTNIRMHSGGTTYFQVGTNGIGYINSSKIWTAGNDGTGSGLDADKLDGAELSIDGTFAANSDTKIPSEKAIKTYIASQVGGAGADVWIVDRASITTNTTIDTTNALVFVDATSASVTVTLPAASSCDGQVFTIKKTDASTNSVTIDPNGAETIDGQATYTWNMQYKVVSVACDGTSWYII